MKKRLARIRTERNQVTTDVLTIDDNVMNLESKLEDMYEPVEKPEDQVFLMLDGSAYYDIESEDDVWIRICLERGDLIVIPKGKSHRYTTTPKNFAKIQRFGVRADPSQG